MIKKLVKNKAEKIVLVGVLKDKRDFDILSARKWYRIPLSHAPARRFDYLAFYQPASFGRRGRCIQYYARVLDSRTVKRNDLLPNESNHPRAQEHYLCLYIGRVKKLLRLIRNVAPRRISFGFTTLDNLLKSKNILQLYNIAPTEQIVENALRRAGIETVSQHYVLSGKKRYRLDFAVFCRKGSIAVECDNKKAHSSPCQREKDKIKNIFLRRRGWIVIRLTEHDIISNLKGCIARVQKAVRKLGGGIGLNASCS